jgi:starch phosphorylase
VLDGWWPEAYDGSHGWAIGGEVDHDHGAQDWRHAQELYGLLLEQALPRYYDRGEDGLPAEWLAMVRSALRTIGPHFGAGRMVLDYVRQIYPPEVPAGV